MEGKEITNPEVLVLLSGGLDSTAALDFYVSLGRPVTAMFVDYGQAASAPERRAARAIAQYFDVDLEERVLAPVQKKDEGEIPLRNAFLMALAAMERPPTVSGIAAGIHGGTTYSDCSTEFVAMMQQVLRMQHRPVDLLVPFLSWTKIDVIAYCDGRRIPCGLTYSCERGSVPPCGECASCRDRRELDARA